MDFFELKVRKKSYKIKLKRKLSPSTIWYSIICFKVVKKKRVIFQSGMYEHQEKKHVKEAALCRRSLKNANA